MKKFSLAPLLLMLLVFVTGASIVAANYKQVPLSAQTAPFIVAMTPQTPPDCTPETVNPYCPFVPAQSNETKECPVGYHPDLDCIIDCNVTFCARMDMLHTAACNIWNAQDAAYSIELTSNADEYAGCIASGATASLCQSMYLENNRQSRLKVCQKHADLATVTANREAAITAARDSCIQGCDCIPDPPTPLTVR